MENALKHGISKLPDGGNIDIEISVEENLIILVKNDGSDIDLEKMADILVYHPSESELLSFKPEGYGVQNIFRRIKVICGEGYGLSYSVERARTVCRITLPIKETDDSSSGPSDEAKQKKQSIRKKQRRSFQIALLLYADSVTPVCFLKSWEKYA